MRKCTNCTYQFERNEIRKATWLRRYGNIKCSNIDCGVEYSVDFWSKIKLSLLIVVPFSLLTLIFNLLLDKRFSVVIGLYLLWIALLVFYTPSIVKYHENL